MPVIMEFDQKQNAQYKVWTFNLSKQFSDDIDQVILSRTLSHA